MANRNAVSKTPAQLAGVVVALEPDGRNLQVHETSTVESEEDTRETIVAVGGRVRSRLSNATTTTGFKDNSPVRRYCTEDDRKFPGGTTVILTR